MSKLLELLFIIWFGHNENVLDHRDLREYDHFVSGQDHLFSGLAHRQQMKWIGLWATFVHIYMPTIIMFIFISIGRLLYKLKIIKIIIN